MAVFGKLAEKLKELPVNDVVRDVVAITKDGNATILTSDNTQLFISTLRLKEKIEAAISTSSPKYIVSSYLDNIANTLNTEKLTPIYSMDQRHSSSTAMIKEELVRTYYSMHAQTPRDSAIFTEISRNFKDLLIFIVENKESIFKNSETDTQIASGAAQVKGDLNANVMGQKVG